ncbi:MAG TPA: hypothetical protein VGE21_02295 [Flavobacteriales bacterium]
MLSEAPFSEELLLQALVSVARQVPRRPKYFTRSTVLIRRGPLPAFYAIYCHERQRFIELQYDLNDGRGRQVLAVPEGRQPPFLQLAPLASEKDGSPTG